MTDTPYDGRTNDVRIVNALESIAASLEKIANPAMLVLPSMLDDDWCYEAYN